MSRLKFRPRSRDRHSALIQIEVDGTDVAAARISLTGRGNHTVLLPETVMGIPTTSTYQFETLPDLATFLRDRFELPF